MSDLFDNARSKAAQGLKLKPLETISLEGPCIDNQKRLNAFNRAIDTADRELQALTATISAQGARIAELEEGALRLGKALAVELYKVESYEKMVALICQEAHITPKQLAFFAKRSQEMEITE